MSGLICATYGTAEETAVNAALASTIDGTDSNSFGAHVCMDEAARRALLSSSVSIDVTAEVEVAAHGGDITAVAASVATVMAAAASDGSFASAVVAEASSAGLTTMASVEVTAATVFGSPSPAPSSAAGGTTIMSSADERDLSAIVLVGIALAVIGVCIVFIVIALVFLFAKMQQRSSGKAQIYSIEPQETGEGA